MSVCHIEKVIYTSNIYIMSNFYTCFVFTFYLIKCFISHDWLVWRLNIIEATKGFLEPETRDNTSFYLKRHTHSLSHLYMHMSNISIYEQNILSDHVKRSDAVLKNYFHLFLICLIYPSISEVAKGPFEE